MTRQRPTAPRSELSQLQERLNRLLEQALLGGGGELPEGGPSAGWRPLLDLVETHDAFILYAELPGVSKEHIQLDCDGRTLELAGQRRPHAVAPAGPERPAGERGFLRMEGSYGPFRRRLELPEPVVVERIEARFRQGILEVRLPKRGPVAVGTEVPVREG